MARRDAFNIYDKTHTLQIFTQNNFSGNRSVNINITDLKDNTQVKLRDVQDFVFNYTANIDFHTFESMRNKQCLDIDYNEFKSNLIEMLQQVQRQEMFLKFELEQTPKLVFFGKSKIKSIIFLTIDLQRTDQREIFNEMNHNILELQAINKNLNNQLQVARQLVDDKDSEIEKSASVNKQIERRFRGELENLNLLVVSKVQECSTKLVSKILVLSQKLVKLIRDVEIVKRENLVKSGLSARLLRDMENLQLESLESSRVVNEVKRENCNLKSLQLNVEKTVAELNKTIERKENEYTELKRQKEEMERDVKQATLIVAQKTAANDELAKDVVQANQMLVNFNHLFDTKKQELEEFKNLLVMKDKLIQEQNLRFQQLVGDFEGYKSRFNEEQMNKLSHDLFIANKRIEEVEKLNRETVKLNELLTRKLASGDFTRRH